MRVLFTLSFLLCNLFCQYTIVGQTPPARHLVLKTSSDVQVGCERTTNYLPIIRNKKIAIVANQTSRIGTTHLVDSLHALGICIVTIFAPEHGFRGENAAGEIFSNSRDAKTGLPVVALYGNHSKPTKEDLKDVDMVVFDIQDVGARFYTYISTLQLVMEACAENKKTLIVFDRPNPNGFYVDGPVLQPAFKSFVGMTWIPIVYGMTIGEYARMLNGEKWLKKGVQCNLKVIPIQNYSHNDLYQLPAKPSPNLPNMTSVYLYPSLCLFEGTQVSIGRGTSSPFQLVGYPGYGSGDTSFTPHRLPEAPHPIYEDTLCRGFNLSSNSGAPMMMGRQLDLLWLINMYESFPEKERFFNSYFDTLAGNSILREQIAQGMSVENIQATWQNELSQFKKIRKKYLLYEDFE